MSMAASCSLERGLGLCFGGHCSPRGPPVSRWGFGAAFPKGCSTVGRKSDSVLRRSPADCAALIRPTEGGPAMPFYEKGEIRIHYEEVGSGFPLMVIPGGGLN